MEDTTPTPTPDFHDVPSTDNIFTPEDAERQIRKLEADIKQYPNHPLWHKDSPVQEDWLAYQSRLYQIKHQDDDGLTPIQSAMQEGLEIQQEQEAERATAAQSALDELSQYGWGGIDVTELEGGPVLPHELSCLEILLDVEKNNYDGDDGAMRKFDVLLSKYPHIPDETFENWHRLREAHGRGGTDLLTTNEKRVLSLRILEAVRDYGREQAGLSPRPEIRTETDITGAYEDDEY